MKISYFVHWSGAEGSGVFHKVVAQVKQWAAAGHEVALGVCSAADTRTSWRTAMPATVQFRLHQYSSRWDRLAAPAELASWLVGANPDIVYFRNDPWTPALERMMRAVPTVIEVNSDDLMERQKSGWPNAVAHNWGRERLFKLAAGAVFVDDKLQELRSFRSLSCPSKIIGNGAALDEIQVVPPVTRSEIRLLSLVSSEQPWHGLDLLPNVLDLRPDWSIDVVGLSGPDEGTRPHPRIHYHGRKSRDGFASIAATADAGIGTLALFRLGMSSISPLKHREYLGMGIPLILGCDDTDIPRDSPWACFVANRRSGFRVALSKVDQFLDRWKGRRVPRTDIAHLDVRVKEVHRLAFFESVLRGFQR